MRAFVFLSLVAVALASRDCGENEHFETCGTACPLTCENYQNPPKFCVLRCDIGCHCDKGYVRAADGRCVRPEECPASAPEPEVQTCTEMPEPGHCMAYFPMWYYDGFTQKCVKFVYGGCGGNGNRYSSEEACMKNCQGIVAEEDSEACDMPAETGVCRGFFPRYYFDRTTGTCQKFVYGGCGGNENNFETKEECQKRCGSAAPSACLEEKVVGPCRAMFRRFYFNKESGECEQFTYGGCQGNSNNFISKEDCEAVCKGSAAPSACLEEKVVGPCRAMFRRFYFNKESGECEQFTYGGCQGNSNNFISKEDCEAVCKA